MVSVLGGRRGRVRSLCMFNELTWWSKEYKSAEKEGRRRESSAESLHGRKIRKFEFEWQISNVLVLM